jgi:hypothetical protein
MGNLLLKRDESIQYFKTGETVIQTVNVTPTQLKNRIEVRLNDLDNTIIVVEDWTLDFSTLKNAVKPFSNTLYETRISGRFGPANISVFTANNLTNLSLRTYPERVLDPRSGLVANLSNRYIQILVKDFNESFTDGCNIIVYSPDLSNVTANIDTTEFNGSLLSLLDTFTVAKDTTYTDSNYNRYTITAPSYVDYMEVNGVNGILDKSKVKLTSGSGTVRVLKNSVDGSDKITFKVGFINYPNLTTFVDE